MDVYRLEQVMIIISQEVIDAVCTLTKFKFRLEGVYICHRLLPQSLLTKGGSIIRLGFGGTTHLLFLL